DAADDDDDDGEDGREDGAIDEEAGEHRRLYEAACGGDGAGCGPGRMLTFCGATVTPGRTRWMPFTMTQSVCVIPSVMVRRPSYSPPSFTGRYSTTFLSLTTRTYLRSWSVPIARSFTSSSGLGSLTAMRTRTNRPGVNRAFGLSSTARTRMVP